MSESFFPIDRRIFTSSLWLLGTSDEKTLWVWLLGNCSVRDGVVRERELAISRGSGLSREAVDAALRKFSEPDPDSRTPDNDGRRIARTEDGFVLVLNHHVYFSKDYSTPRVKRFRRRKAEARARFQRHETQNRGPKQKTGLGLPEVKRQTVTETKDKDKDRETDKRTNERTDARPALPAADQASGLPSRGPTDNGDGARNEERQRLEAEAWELADAIAAITGRDRYEVMAKGAYFEGQKTSKVDPATMTFNRLVNTVLDLRATLKTASAKAQPPSERAHVNAHPSQAVDEYEARRRADRAAYEAWKRGGQA
jgi:hypothetical protein